MSLKYQIINSGYCLHSEFSTIRTGKTSQIQIPANFVLIEHNEYGYILFDTGYSNRFYDATKHFPYNIYAKITKVFTDESQSAVNRLLKLGIEPEDVKYVFISHFHADHICSLKDFVNAKYICSQVAYQNVKNKTGFKALLKGFLPKLLPNDFINRVQFIEDFPQVDYNNLVKGYDIFNDKSIIAIRLDGHTEGQMGLILNSNILLAADACWNPKTYKDFILPPDYVLNILGNKKQYMDTVKILNKLYSENKMKIILSHYNSEE